MSNKKINEYLKEFHLNPETINDQKITFLKEYTYSSLSTFMYVSFENFLIGVTFNKNLLFFKSKIDDSYEIIYSRRLKDYFCRYKDDKCIYTIEYYLKNKNLCNSSTSEISPVSSNLSYDSSSPLKKSFGQRFDDEITTERLDELNTSYGDATDLEILEDDRTCIGRCFCVLL